MSPLRVAVSTLPSACPQMCEIVARVAATGDASEAALVKWSEPKRKGFWRFAVVVRSGGSWTSFEISQPGLDELAARPGPRHDLVAGTTLANHRLSLSPDGAKAELTLEISSLVSHLHAPFLSSLRSPREVVCDVPRAAAPTCREGVPVSVGALP